MANAALDTLRKDQRTQLTTKERRGLMHDRFVLLKRRHDLSDKAYPKFSGRTANYPMLKAAYDAKEAFYRTRDHGYPCQGGACLRHLKEQPNP